MLRYNKYLVLKQADINKYLSIEQRNALEYVVRFIANQRKADGLKHNTYVVVNEDEPYAEKVWQLIEESGTS